MWKGLHEMVVGRLKLPGSEDTRWSGGAVKLLSKNSITKIFLDLEIARTGPRPLEMGVSDNPSKIDRN